MINLSHKNNVIVIVFLFLITISCSVKEDKYYLIEEGIKDFKLPKFPNESGEYILQLEDSTLKKLFSMDSLSIHIYIPLDEIITYPPGTSHVEENVRPRDTGNLFDGGAVLERISFSLYEKAISKNQFLLVIGSTHWWSVDSASEIKVKETTVLDFYDGQRNLIISLKSID